MKYNNPISSSSSSSDSDDNVIQLCLCRDLLKSSPIPSLVPLIVKEAETSKREKLCNKPMKREKRREYWLLKTEPGEWSWEDQRANGAVSKWDGVKNKQAQNNLKAMRLGDLCLFYHSGNRSRCVVGVVSVVREWYTEGESDDGAVDVKAVGEMKQPVDLKEMKRDKELKGFQLLRQPRLSVVPMEKNVWDRICELGGGYENDSSDGEENNGC